MVLLFWVLLTCGSVPPQEPFPHREADLGINSQNNKTEERDLLARKELEKEPQKVSGSELSVRSASIVFMRASAALGRQL